MDMQYKIDFVIPWVDGNDPKWIEEFNKYSPQNKLMNTQSRFKDWDNLVYIFRAFEYFTPWVNKIFFITFGHVPEWLNINHKKLVIVKHEDYIGKDNLPVFSSHPIEINIHKIKGLSEKFVYFNDDTFILKKICYSTFFKHDLPVDIAILDVLHDGVISHIVLNNIDIINKNFNRHVKSNLSKRRIIWDNFFKWFSPSYGFQSLRTLFLMYWKGHTGFIDNHHPQPFLRSTFEQVWEKENELLMKTTASKFRDKDDVNQYLFRYWQLVTASFTPGSFKKFYQKRNYVEIKTKIDAINTANDIKSGYYEMYCLNDATSKGRYTKEDASSEDFEAIKKVIKDALHEILPDKSSFEK